MVKDYNVKGKIPEITNQQESNKKEQLAAIGTLTCALAHELRNIFVVIKGAAHMLNLYSKPDPKTRRQIDTINIKIDAANKLVKDILSFSHIPNPEVKPEKIDKVLNAGLLDIKRLLKKKKIKVVKKNPASLPKVLIDKAQINQVFHNLFINACDAMDEDGTLSVSVEKEKKFLKISIADTGCGIPEKDFNMLSSPFFSRKHNGFGLGLMVSYQIVALHHGTINVMSEVGTGTTFIINLPLT